jgi:hypothetical protein
VNAKLQRIEIQSAVARDHYLAVQHTLFRQLSLQWLEQLGEVAIQRFLVPALQQHFVPIAEDQGPKPIPLGLE